MPFFSFLDYDKVKSRDNNKSIDSLRYFLASFVFISHSVRMIDFIKNGTWKGSINEINFLAVMGVSIFFSITAILFWGRISDKEINFFSLYKNRFFRIVPLIWFNSIVVGCVATFIVADVPSSNFIYWFDPINNTRPDFNAFIDTHRLTGGVFWTITYEWWFYFLIPVMYLFRKIKLQTSLALFVSIYFINEYLNTTLKLGVIYPFIIGMLASDLASTIKIRKIYLDLIALLALIALLWSMPKLHSVNSYSNILILIFVFCVSSKSDLFGILRLPGFKRLGDASYSIYAMHPIVLYIVYSSTERLGYLDEYRYTTLIASYLLILVVSLITHRYVERFFISIGKRFAAGRADKVGDST
ncbi:acyltransferase family protein [Citrobacter koseri]|uniref:acyltransferase family protein n=1 Tax=Citrobacter koseri TaxID=545 RepID=UPI0040418B74